MGYRLYVLGAGPGNIQQVTPAVKTAIADSRTVACAARYFPLVEGHPHILEMKSFKETFDILREELKTGNAALLLSGDTGIFSLLPLIKKNFPDEDICVLPGISSLQILCAIAGETWHDAVILSGHGRDISEMKILEAAEHNRSVIFFCDAKKNPAWVCTLLASAGLGMVEAVIGEKLGARDERVSRGFACKFAQNKFDDLSIVLLINENYTKPLPLLPDDTEFLRIPGVPMTHEEVRSVILSKLCLTSDSVLWDIGAGTGSVSIAAAQLCREVHAVEINSIAAELIRANALKFRLHNIKVYEGSAVDTIDSLPDPDVVFIGGSGPELSGILKKISCIAPDIRIVVSAVSLKTIALCTDNLLKESFADFDAVQLAVSRIKTVGKTQIWQAQNPVVIFSAKTRDFKEE
ncbi:MAG: precorrin-6y C5,15-methyltransferase (decarboxylating) subunit CbiE [Synergistaceae bacterium]|nr:precorrin-6y C5,15-methyltransferase (decarboxylating) subunit CbiE [Synergistaceae bacterium]